jgi:purine catabolism regulator
VLVAVSDPRELTRFVAMARPGLTLGASERVPTAQIAAARDQAVHSLQVARSRRVPSMGFGELTRLGLSGVVEPEAATAFAAATLERLTAYERTSKVDLRESLRVWLSHHGQFEPAAGALGIHRHTLRYRVRKAADLLGRDLDDPSVRMDLWFALTVHSGQA